MKKTGYILLGLALVLGACEKVVDVDLNESSPQTVIEANVSDTVGPYTVVVTETGSYFGETVIKEIMDAQVTLEDSEGNSEVMPHVGNGLYMSATMMAVPGRSYTVTVNRNDVDFVATATMPQRVPLDSLTSFLDENGFGQVSDPPLYSVFTNFRDPAGVKNYYTYRTWVNGKPQTSSFQPFINLEDAFIDGNPITYPVFGIDIFEGDTVIVEMRSIEKETYLYYESINDVAGGFNSTTPYNPEGNWTNKALGYFSAYTMDRDTIIVQP